MVYHDISENSSVTLQFENTRNNSYVIKPPVNRFIVSFCCQYVEIAFFLPFD